MERLATIAKTIQITAAIGILTTAISSCSGGGTQTKVKLPSSSPSATGTQTSAPSTSSPEEAVKTAYTAFWPQTSKALAGPPEQIRPTLSVTSTGEYLDFQVRNALQAQELHRGPWGTGPVIKVTKVQVTGSKAVVWDCQDARQAALQDVTTHQIIEGTRGSAKVGYQADLERGGDGRWRVSGLNQRKASCS